VSFFCWVGNIRVKTSTIKRFWVVGSLADRWQPLLCSSLWCGDADGLGSCHELDLTLVARQQVVCPLCGRRGLSLSVGSPRQQVLKREPGGWRGRIIPKRCVSSMLICHPLNLYCSSTGSISHIARTLVLLRHGSLLSLRTEAE